MPDMKADTRVIEFENVITFSPALSIVNLIQYENVSNTLGFNARLRWNLQSGQDIWFVLSHGMLMKMVTSLMCKPQRHSKYAIPCAINYILGKSNCNLGY